MICGASGPPDKDEDKTIPRLTSVERWHPRPYVPSDLELRSGRTERIGGNPAEPLRRHRQRMFSYAYAKKTWKAAIAIFLGSFR